jgi:3,4-dihydroxy-9,10-secoandrosta-1,3,5(10)-triene-9,17-dione 4,5-dioxygenase
MDERVYRVAVERGESGLAYLGFELNSRAELDELAGCLETAGFAVKEDTHLAARRRVRTLFRCQDPAGNDIELFVGQLTVTDPFASPREARFKTGSLGVGHAVVYVPDGAEAWHFYVELLAFRLSDTASLGPVEAVFLHCNPRHHSIAFVAVPDVVGLDHFMIEADSLQTVGVALDVARQRGDEIRMGLGMHPNDQMVSFYVNTPSGFAVEYGWNGRLVDDASWTAGHYERASVWGHTPG